MKRLLHGMFVAVYFGLLLALLPDTTMAGTGDETADSATDLTALSPEELMRVEVATVYSASKFEQKVTEAPSSVSIVTADEIRKYGYRSLADILRSLRSFFITYDRNYSYVGARGFGRAGDYNSRILLLIDGHRINENVYDSSPIGTEFPLDVDLIDRVEVIRGPGSSLYGNNAFFAVINVLTRRGRDLAGVEVSGEAGSFDSYKGRATWGESFHNGLEAFLSGSYYDSKGDRLFFKEFATAANNNGITDHTDHDRFDSAFAKFSYADFTLGGLYSTRTKGIPTASFGTDFNEPRNKTTDGWWFVDLKYDHDLGNSLNVMGRLFYDAYDYEGDYLYGGAVNKDLGKGRWWGGEAQLAATLLDRHKLVVGSEFRDNLRQDQQNYDVAPAEVFVDDRRTSRIWAVYLQDEFSILNNLILNAGVRYDYYSTFGSTVNPRLGLIYTPFDGTVFKLLYGGAFRAPNVYELYYQTAAGGQKGNSDLGPEKIKTYELIYEQYIGNNIRGTVTGFYYDIDNLIAQVTDPADGLLVFRNLDQVKAEGAEAELEGKWDNGLSGRVSYSFVHAEDSATGRTLGNSPQHLAKLNLTIPLLGDKVFLGVEERFTSRRKSVIGNYAKEYFVTNLTLFSRDLLKNLELSASVYNLFDYRFGDPGGEEHVQDNETPDPSRFADPAHPLDIIEQDGRVFRVKLTYRF